MKLMLELEEKYELIHCFRVNKEQEFLNKVKDLVNTKDLKNVYLKRREKLLNETIDVSSFLIWLFENYPKSIDAYYLNPDIQDQFK